MRSYLVNLCLILARIQILLNPLALKSNKSSIFFNRITPSALQQWTAALDHFHCHAFLTILERTGFLSTYLIAATKFRRAGCARRNTDCRWRVKFLPPLLALFHILFLKISQKPIMPRPISCLTILEDH